jgi:DNA-binding CsgD family transcriptional regulator
MSRSQNINNKGLKLLIIVLSLLLSSNTIWSQDAEFYKKIEQADHLINFNVDSAATLIQRIQESYQANSNLQSNLELELLKVKLLFAQGAFKESIETGEKLLLKCSKLKNPRFELEALLALGKCYQYGGIKPRQFELNQRVFDLAYVLSDTSAIIKALHSNGDIHRNSGNDDRCYKYYTLAYKLALYTQNVEDLAECNKYLGTYHLWKTKNDSSILYLNRARIGFEELNRKDMQSVCWIRICRAYVQHMKLDSAEMCIKNAVTLSKELHSKLWLGRSYIQYGRVLQTEKKFDIALKYYDSSQVNLTQAEDIIVLNGAYQNKSLMFKKLGALDSSLIYFKKHVKLKDSIKKRQNYDEIVSMEWQLDAEQKERKISFLHEKSRILDSKNQAEQRSKIWLFTALGTMTFLTILIFQLFKQRNKSLTQEKKLRELDRKQATQEFRHQEEINEMSERQHKLELGIKNKELTTLTMEISQKSQNITDIHQKIKGLEETIKPDSKIEFDMLNELRGISKQLKFESGKEKEWQQFKLHFEQVHSSFFDNLKNTHPSLTAYDLKLCAYFHMNLGIKQVANIMNVSYAAIKKQRTRMRKKMNLYSKTSLLNYLNSLSDTKQ